MNSFSLIRDMVVYWRAPVFGRPREHLNPGGALELIGLVCLVLLALIPLGLLMSVVMETAGSGVPEMSEEFEEQFVSPNFIFTAVLLAPLVEETLFRSWLSFRTGLLVVMPVLLCVFTGIMILFQGQGSPLSVGTTAFMVGTLGLYLSRWWSLRRRSDVLDGMAHQVFPWIFWGVVLLFGLIHVGNFEAGVPVWLWPVIVSPQILAGAVLGYVRMRFGLLVGIAFHATYNFIIVSLSTVAMVGAEGAAGMVALLT